MKDEILNVIEWSAAIESEKNKLSDIVDRSIKEATASAIQEMVDEGVRCEKISDGTIVVWVGFMHIKFRADSFFPNHDDCDTDYESTEADFEIIDV